MDAAIARAVLEDAAADYGRVPPATTAARARTRLADLMTTLRGTLPLDERRELLRVAVDTAILGGYGEFTAGRQAQAADLFGHATVIARQSAEPELQARAAGAASTIVGPHGTSQPAAALRLLDHALALSERGLIRTWLHMRQAESLAALGRTDEALAAVDRAWTFYGHGDHGGLFTRTGLLSNWTPEFLDGMAGRCYSFLGYPTDAEVELGIALRSTDASNQRTRAMWLADLAQSRAGAGQVDGAVDAATESLRESRAAGYGLGETRIRQLARTLPDTPEAARLDRLLATHP